MPSSVIHGMLYSPAARTLDIVFRDDRGTYRYFGVSPSEWQGFKRAPSKGKHLNFVFKGAHPEFVRFEDLPTQLSGTLAASLTVFPQDRPDDNVWGFFDQL